MRSQAMRAQMIEDLQGHVRGMCNLNEHERAIDAMWREVFRLQAEADLLTCKVSDLESKRFAGVKR